MVLVNDETNKGYYLSPQLKLLWDKTSLEKMKKKNMDRVYIVDGRERLGKSTFAFQQGAYIDKKILSSPEEFCSRVCFTPEDFHEAVKNTKNGVIFFDEAFRGLSSRSAMSKVNKLIIQTLMEMGQHNNIVFIILPSVFMLDVYPAMLRSDGLFNIFEDRKSGKRCWRGYNRRDKNQIYQIGIRKGWNYFLPTRFRDWFFKKFPGGDEFEKAYLAKKAHALSGIGKRTAIEEEKANAEEWSIYNDLKSGKKILDVAAEHETYPERVRRIRAKLKFLEQKEKQ